MVKFGANIWNKFYKYYADAAKKRDFPVFFIRYEDAATNNR